MVKELTRKMKDSGVDWIGEIPQDVDIISNKYLFKYIKGKNPKEFNSEKRGLPYIGASDLEKDGDIHDYENYSIEELPTVEKDETLILWDGARAGLIGIGHTGYIGSTIVKIIPRVDYIDKRYWYWYLKGFQPLLLDWVGGTTIPHMNRKFINEIKFINFPLSQQKSIADFLDKKTKEINNIISKTKKAIEEYKKYKQSLITETVTKGLDENVQMKDSGIEWVGEIPEHWGLERLKYSFLEHKSKNIGNKEKNVLSLSYGNIVKRNIKDNFGLLPESFESYNIVKPGVIVLRLTDLQNDKKSWRVGISKQIGIITSAYVSLLNKDKNNRYSPYYYYFIHSLDYKKVFYNLGDGVRQSMSYMDIGNIEIVIPPLKEQKQIANYLDNKCSQIDQIISSKEKLLREMEAYKKSLIYETVTGKREVK